QIGQEGAHRAGEALEGRNHSCVFLRLIERLEEFRGYRSNLFFRGLLPRIPMHLKKLKWPEVQALDFDRRIALVPLGSIEQHSLHLPLSVDTDIVTELAERVEGARPERIRSEERRVGKEGRGGG